MAKNAETATENTAAPVAEAPKKKGNVIVLKNVPESMTHPIDLSDESLKKLAGGKTKEQPRAEFIREMWATGHYDRSAIRNMIAAFGDDPEVKYQIVFQATKGHEGGPAPKTTTEAAGESASEEGAAAE